MSSGYRDLDLDLDLGLGLEGRAPRHLHEADGELAHVVVTMRGGDACPRIPGAPRLGPVLDGPVGRCPNETRAIRGGIASDVAALVAGVDRVPST